MPDNPIILSREIVAESRLFGVERLALRFSNGEERVYERLRTPSIPAVLIVAVKENGNVVLIREYCCGTGRYELTLPKGAMDHPGEAVFEAYGVEGAVIVACLYGPYDSHRVGTGPVSENIARR